MIIHSYAVKHAITIDFKHSELVGLKLKYGELNIILMPYMDSTDGAKTRNAMHIIILYMSLELQDVQQLCSNAGSFVTH